MHSDSIYILNIRQIYTIYRDAYTLIMDEIYTNNKRTLRVARSDTNAVSGGASGGGLNIRHLYAKNRRNVYYSIRTFKGFK
jgi:hypothetical protein